jgi:signal transduction histidine kinase
LEPNPQPATPLENDYASRGLRLALLAGFGGVAIIFLFATIDAITLLREMRAENQVLRGQALDRTRHLASIRSSILLTHAYLGDYSLDSARPVNLARVQETWARMRADLADYHASTLDEDALVKQLASLLDRNWPTIAGAIDSPAQNNPDEMLPIRTSMVEITADVEYIDGMQAASTEAEIQREFEHVGARLRSVLTIALVAALLLALGSLIYIFRIERQNRRRYEEIVNGRKALEKLSARLVEAQESERRTISRELHDEVGQTLNALLVDAANLAKRLPLDDADSRRYLDNIRTFADSSINSIRDIALLLRPSMLDDLGLVPALEWQAREVSRRTGIKVDVTAENVPDSLPDGVRTTVYRLVQEALNNITRHSGAKSVVITVRHDAGSLFLSVTDDGRGFDPKRTRGLGMLGMEERVRQLGGRFEIQSAPGKGTALRVTLPAQPVPATE